MAVVLKYLRGFLWTPLGSFLWTRVILDSPLIQITPWASAEMAGDDSLSISCLTDAVSEAHTPLLPVLRRVLTPRSHACFSFSVTGSQQSGNYLAGQFWLRLSLEVTIERLVPIGTTFSRIAHSYSYCLEALLPQGLLVGGLSSSPQGTSLQGSGVFS